MKKVFLLTALIIVLGACKKENGIESLSGTIWEYVENDGNYKSERAIAFQKTTYAASYKEWVNKNGQYELSESKEGAGTYTYEHPIVMFSENGNSFSATISGSKMIINGENITYLRKD